MKRVEKEFAETTVLEDVQADSELRKKLLCAKQDILNGNTYKTEEVIEMIDRGEI